MYQMNTDDTSSTIADLTLAEVSEEIETVLREVEPDDAKRAILRDKLVGYQWISELSQLKLGRWIRWIKSPNPLIKKTLTNGGFLTNITETDCLLCRNGMGRLIQVKFDDVLIFQKFSADENLILLATTQLRS